MKNPFIITIDGPAAAGKGTIAYLLARRYGFLDIDSGAIFRAITWLALEGGVPLDMDHQTEIAALAREHELTLVAADDFGGKMGMQIDGRDVGQAIRSEKLSNLVPKVSAMPKVRAVVVDLQHGLASKADQGVVIEGRDTGTAVFPQAQLKIFLTASAEERAQRRHAELVEQGKDIVFEEVYSDLIARDLADIERTHSPLAKPADAVVLDTTGMLIEEVVERIGVLVEKRLPSKAAHSERLRR